MESLLPRYGVVNAFNDVLRSEIINVPDRMVGLIIGKGGEQIANIQATSDCRIQFAPESYGMPDRPCTLTGTSEAIQKAKDMIAQIMSKGHDLPPDLQNTSQTIELMIPGNKAGIIIGKGGETIKLLQEQTGVKMVIIQENNSPTTYDKPLRITGDRLSCQRAKEKVLSLLAEKDVQITGYGEYTGSNQRTSIDIPVSRSMIGVVIGKGGEMIKKIQQESGARIQFRPDDESSGPNRLCNITGNSEQMQAAIGLIQEIVEKQDNSTLTKNFNNLLIQEGVKKFEGINEEISYTVPADKCGLVIGKVADKQTRSNKLDKSYRTLYNSMKLYKMYNSMNPVKPLRVRVEPSRVRVEPLRYKSSRITYLRLEGINNPTSPPTLLLLRFLNTKSKPGGETIREICRSSGAHVELNREANNPASIQRLFRIVGSQEQIQSAIRLISDKVGTVAPTLSSATLNTTALRDNNNNNNQFLANLYGHTNLQAMQQLLQAQQQQHQQPQQQNFMSPIQTWPTTFQTAYAPTATPAEQFKPVELQAQWTAHIINQQQQQQQLQQLISQQQQSQFLTRAALPSPGGINPQTGQPDYSLQWADYYRQQGMHEQAQAILQATTINQLGQGI
ncbi:hypothetical protein HELRODRAFT_188314 [Helobdella robusta]|uniref:K Homology domain-containing protein n=1 Tax=Helobdella robusta TaxID=6412 RepID=T1FPV3_HELRO|nr:hypothetical protein HELRODRAFT_188314 [Helobdella robusta]ESO06280.1 hypothetical protein HELRODRAFT_188314 [Helobdella robusta]